MLVLYNVIYIVCIVLLKLCTILPSILPLSLFILSTNKIYFKFFKLINMSDIDYHLYFFSLGNIAKSTFFLENNSQ